MALGPILGAGGEVARKALESRHGRKEVAATNQQTVVEGLVRGGEAKEARDLVTDVAKIEQRGKNIRRGMAVLALAGVVGGGAYIANTFKEALKGAGPKANRVTEAQVGAAISHVDIDTTTPLVRVSGTSTARLNSKIQFCVLHRCVEVPGSGKSISAHVTGELGVSAKKGSIDRSARINPDDGQPQAVVTAHIHGLELELSNTKEIPEGDANGLLAEAGFIDKNKVDLFSTAIKVAKTRLTRDAAKTAVPTLPAAVAERVHQSIEEAQDLVQSTETKRILAAMAKEPVYVKFVDQKDGKQVEVCPAAVQLPVPPEAAGETTLAELGPRRIVATPEAESGPYLTLEANQNVTALGQARSFVVSRFCEQQPAA